MIVGVDPGLKGAIAFLDGLDVEVHDMPVFRNPRGTKDIINVHALGSLLVPRTSGRRIAVIELVGPHPQDSKASAFSFGRGYGALEMAVIGHGYEVHYVTPAVWKKHFKLSRDKGVSRSLATQRFPGAASLFTRVKDDGRAEAALIALWGAEKILLSAA